MKKLILLGLISLFFFCGNTYAQTTISINGTTYQADTIDYYKVGPGTYYTAMHYYTSSVKLRTFYLEIDATNPYISFEAAHGRDSLITTERISSMAQRKSVPGKNYFCGVNADFFATTTNAGYPNHGSVVEGQIGRTPNNTPHFAFSGKDVLIDNIKFSGSKAKFNGNSYTINGVNIDRSENKLILYNTLRGNYTRTNEYGVEVVLDLLPSEAWIVNKTLKAKVMSITDGVGNTKIQPLKAVLSGHGTAAETLRALSVDDEVELFLGFTNTYGTTDNVTAMVGGDRITLLNGEIQDNDWSDRHPRTAVGYSADKSKIYFCVIDGRSNISSGLSTKHMADIMKHIGASTAVNLDGGGSSGLYIDNFGIMNTPSDGNERAVCNGIFAVELTETDNNITEILPSIRSVKLPPYGSFTPIILGYNQYEKLIDTDVRNVTFTCDPSVGTMISPTLFYANGTKDGMLQVKYGNLETAIHIQYLKAESIALRLDSVIVDGLRNYSIEVNSTVQGEQYILDPNALIWTVDEPEICSVAEGVLTGLKNGVTWVRGDLNGLTCALKVIVEIPESNSISLLPLEEDNGWVVNGSSNISNKLLNEDGFSYSYASGRAPYIELANSLRLYSLPDAIRMTINPGSAGLSKVQVQIRENLAMANAIYDYTQTIEKNKDVSIEIDLASLLGKELEHAVFPLTLYSIKFPMDASDNETSDNKIQIKNLDLVYNNASVGINKPMRTKSLIVYPNPVKNGTITIESRNEQLINKVAIYGITGRQIDLIENNQNTSMAINVSSYPSGNYIFKVIMDNQQSETVKIIVAP